MIKKKLIGFIIVFSILGIGLSYAEWSIYDCSVMPREADTSWHESSATNADDVTEILSVIDDPEIPGNKLLKVDANQANFKEMWRMKWNADPVVGATLVFRVVALDPAAYNRDFDVYVKNGLAEDRLIAEGGDSFKLDKSKQYGSINAMEWHILRITIIADLVEVYIDEETLSYLVGTGTSTTENYFRFGDGSEGSTLGGLYDWIIWDVSGAYPPGQGTPIPQVLLDTGTFPLIVMYASTPPDGFKLSQNYPNPFNPSTKITFSLKTKGHTTLTVYNAMGQLVATLIDETIGTGTYYVTFDARDLPSGVYFYQIKSGEFTQVKKMILTK